MVASCVQAREMFVAQKHPQAADTNAASEALPLKTIQAAVDKSQPGDKIWVKEGNYAETVKLDKAGNVTAPITISAWKDDRVHIGYPMLRVPEGLTWKKIDGSKSWAAVLPEDLPKPCRLFFDGKEISIASLVESDSPPPDKGAPNATYRRSDRTLMINNNGGHPGKGHIIEYHHNECGIRQSAKAEHWIIRGIEFSHLAIGVSHEFSSFSTIENCYFHAPISHAIFCAGGQGNWFRRNAFNGVQYAFQGTPNTVLFEENLIVNCPEPMPLKGYGYALQVRYNIFADNGGGLWFDGTTFGARVVGNAFWDNQHGNGIYNEYCVNDTLILGNYFRNTIASSSWCTRMSVIDNFFEGGMAVWFNRDIWPFRHSYMVLRGNAFADAPAGYLQIYGRGIGEAYLKNSGYTGSMYDKGIRNSWADYNVGRIKAGAAWIVNGPKHKLRSMEEIRKEFGWEEHGDIQTSVPGKNDLTPESMGGSTVTFRVPWGPRSHLARPMLCDSQVEAQWPAAAETYTDITTPSFFWRVADGNNDHGVFRTGAPTWMRHMPTSTKGTELGENNGCIWFMDAETKFPEGTKVEGWANVPMSSMGNHWLVMKGVTPASIPDQGIGYWSPVLATAPGAKVKVSLRIRGRSIEPTERGTPVIWLEFRNATMQNCSRFFLLGRDDKGRQQRPELSKGRYDWTEVSETVASPVNAVRMALFMGLRPCKGEMDFDDINIKTESAEQTTVSKLEILPPRVPVERFKETFFVNLAPFANRALADEDKDDGQGGWCDQGAQADMRNMKTGERSFGGVPFKILDPPKSAVVLKASTRPPGDLPEKVAIPVGRKADTLFFLHVAAWYGKDREVFRYVIRYDDGKDAILPVNEMNMTDWTDPNPAQRFPNESGTFSTVAETVPTLGFGQACIYRMEWSAPLDRRSIPIKSITFQGNGVSCPILLGVTGVIEY